MKSQEQLMNRRLGTPGLSLESRLPRREPMAQALSGLSHTCYFCAKHPHTCGSVTLTLIPTLYTWTLPRVWTPGSGPQLSPMWCTGSANNPCVPNVCAEFGHRAQALPASHLVLLGPPRDTFQADVRTAVTFVYLHVTPGSTLVNASWFHWRPVEGMRGQKGGPFSRERQNTIWSLSLTTKHLLVSNQRH